MTGVVIEYANHDNKGGIDPGAAVTLLEGGQKHLNILCDNIFNYKPNHRKAEPDYAASVRRFMDL